MNPLTILKACIAVFLGLALPALAVDQDYNATDGPNVRVLRQQDGSKTVFTRSPDNLTLTKKTFSPNATLELITVYRTDANGNPLSCKIFDGQKVEIYKVSYGYRKNDGKLVEERMFDSRVKRRDPATGQEMPVRRMVYTYDADGKRSKPMAITLIPGAKADDVYRKTSPSFEANPFQDEKDKSGGSTPRGRR